MCIPFTAATARESALQWLAGTTLFLFTPRGANALLKNRLQVPVPCFSWTSAKTANYKISSTKSKNFGAGKAGLVEMISKITKANDDVANFVEATELDLISVDLDKRIIRFTAPARKVFRIQAGDFGRP
ncbi:MAG: PAS domain-containing protein [Burkholderiaceae bacterium]